jgi:hypothetical protein
MAIGDSSINQSVHFVQSISLAAVSVKSRLKLSLSHGCLAAPVTGQNQASPVFSVILTRIVPSLTQACKVSFEKIVNFPLSGQYEIEKFLSQKTGFPFALREAEQAPPRETAAFHFLFREGCFTGLLRGSQRSFRK